MGFKYYRINCIDEETQEHKLLYVMYNSDFFFEKFVGKQGLIIKEQVEVGAAEWLNAPKYKKVSVFTGNEKIPSKPEPGHEQEKRPGLLKKLFRRD